MNSLKVVLLSVASLGLLAYGCAKSDDSSGGGSGKTSAYERKNLPAKTANNLPSSLTKGSSSERTAMAATHEQSLGVNQVRTAVDMSKYMMQSVEQNMNHLDVALKDAGLNIELIRPDSMLTDGKAPQLLNFRHKEFGSEHYFQVTSNTPGLLSQQGDIADWVQTGLDVDGEIAVEHAAHARTWALRCAHRPR